MGAWLRDLCDLLPSLSSAYTFVDAAVFWSHGSVRGVLDLPDDPLDIRTLAAAEKDKEQAKVSGDRVHRLLASVGDEHPLAASVALGRHGCVFSSVRHALPEPSIFVTMARGASSYRLVLVPVRRCPSHTVIHRVVHMVW